MATKESGAKPIPSFRRITINDASEMPDRYSSTPGGTLFSTTPGGTRIIYERAFLMNLRNSPLTKSPPKLPFVPGVTKNLPDNCHLNINNNNNNNSKNINKNGSPVKKRENGDEPQFDMDL